MTTEFEKEKDQNIQDKNIQPVILEELNEDRNPDVSLASIDKLGDVPLPVSVIFANIPKTFEEVISYCEGDVVKLNRFAGEPVDVIVGERIFAKGEITVVDDCFGVRVVEILPSGERIGPSVMEKRN